MFYGPVHPLTIGELLLILLFAAVYFLCRKGKQAVRKLADDSFVKERPVREAEARTYLENLIHPYGNRFELKNVKWLLGDYYAVIRDTGGVMRLDIQLKTKTLASLESDARRKIEGIAAIGKEEE